MFIPEEFYSSDLDDLDVVFLGPSTIMDAILPSDLWEKYGILSYNLGSPEQSMGESYYLARDIIKRSHPQVLVVDAGVISYENLINSSVKLHYITDTMPWNSLERIRMALKLDPENVIQQIFPLDVYHSRWKEITKESSEANDRAVTFGAYLSAGVTTKKEPSTTALDTESTISTWSTYYLQKLIELAQKNNTELLFVTTPTVAVGGTWISQTEYDQRQGIAYQLSKYLSEYNIPHLNYFSRGDELGIQKEDTTDGHHLNIWGAEKYTDFIGNYLSEQYSLDDHRSEASIAKYMSKQMEIYTNAKWEQLLNRASNVKAYFQILQESYQDKKYLVIMSLNGSEWELTDSGLAHQLMKAGGSQSLHNVGDNSYIAVIDQGTVVYESNLQGHAVDEEYRDTINGVEVNIRSSRVSSEDGSIMINGTEYAAKSSGLHVIVYDQEDNRLVDSCIINKVDEQYVCTHKET